jgi:maleamate amidohydrolase
VADDGGGDATSRDSATHRVEAPWEKYLTERDRRVYRDAGFGTEQAFGNRPALVIVDITYAFTGDAPEPIEESIARYPTSCGEAAWESVDHNRRLLDGARRAGIPVFYTRPGYRQDGADLGSWAWKFGEAAHDTMIEGSKGTRIVDEIAPLDSEIVIVKKKPSAFFATPLMLYLTERQVDTVIITGCTTSGCVRASVVDAFSNNLRTVVPVECVFDRGEVTHALNLFDMHQKYAEVVSTDWAIRELERWAGGRRAG